ncbi:mitochondrial transcription rescue factor 1 [Cylas formicarius]|uniref:mitochondrial transcription rescue factor 1 n=1 Tax=Cylas formicarius TaxID=197179 RepID=UPI002958AA96|nr:mitochondrial transcription rescue factor 1 [Cylas formicarius]
MLKVIRRVWSTNIPQVSTIKTRGCSCLHVYMRHSPTIQILKPRVIQSFKWKSTQKKKDTETESESEQNDEDFLEAFDRNTKTMKINVQSPRVDAILKSALGIARNKIETMFYESKIRLNGEKVLKKSVTVQEGDELDIIKGPDPKNDQFLIVSRVEILGISPREEGLTIKVKRCKSLTVENYL